METKFITQNNIHHFEMEKIIHVLKNIFDPEIDFSIYDMGLIYEIHIDKDMIKIIMTLTSVNCPEAQSLPENIQIELSKLYPDSKIQVEITFEPEWSVENMSDEIKLKIGLL
jgi:metal-sulfur cluster biosynthetic enzyme